MFINSYHLSITLKAAMAGPYLNINAWVIFDFDDEEYYFSDVI